MAGMADRRALNTLRVQELKSLCKEEKLSSAGRKNEIIERLIAHRQSLLDSGGAGAVGHVGMSPAASASYVPGSVSPRPKSAGRSGSTGRGKGRGRGRGRGAGMVTGDGIPSSLGAGDLAAGSPAGARRPLKCSSCAVACSVQLAGRGNTQNFMCPTCRFKIMDPFNEVAEPGGILKYCLVQHTHLEFVLDMPELRQWRREGCVIQVRMVQIDCPKVCQAWPRALTCYANDVPIIVVKPPEDGHKRRDVPQQVTMELKAGANRVRFVMEDDRIQDFALAVVLCYPRSVDELRSRVTVCRYEAALTRVKNFVSARQCRSDGGEEIECLTSETLSLRCPITMERIQEPVRGEHCQHLQCFGLEAYLVSNRQMRAFNNRWVCPICSLVLRPGDLRRDAHVDRVLVATPEEVDEVIVAADGTWRALEPQEVPLSMSENSPEALDLDDGPSPQVSPSRKRQRELETLDADGPPLESTPGQPCPVEPGPVTDVMTIDLDED
eukprot:TRINITY_DN34392_c0_g1_i1.p1 TRINITY_DN34392_c0_g1~~TRINITY_DN34392_c0_g1_i1.p1  ORF type:complete len:526 (-),score=69.42 TRINITY_DN34392_c0_g1_i1:93-1577(-)